MDLWGCAHSASFTEKKAEKVRWDYRSVSLYMYCTGLAVHVLYGVWAATGRPWPVGWWDWMVVRFVCVIRVPVCPVSVPAPPLLPPVSFYRFGTCTLFTRTPCTGKKTPGGTGRAAARLCGTVQ